MSFDEQTARIGKLITAINGNNTGTAIEMAEKLGVSRRTIFNDLEFLKGRGFQILFSQTMRSYFFEKKQNNFPYL